MTITQQDSQAITRRVEATKYSLKVVCAVARVSERVARKMLAGGSVEQSTFDTFMSALEQLESPQPYNPFTGGQVA